MYSNTKQIKIVGLGGSLHANSTNLFALKHALQAAEDAGAQTDLLDLNTLEIPLFRPKQSYANQPNDVKEMIERIKDADGLIFSTAAYHGTLAGVTKNALDYLEYLRTGDLPYLDKKVVGLIATAGGEIAGVNSINTMVQIVHALRGTVIPLSVPIAHAKKNVNALEGFIAPVYANKLDALGKLVVETASALRPVGV